MSATIVMIEDNPQNRYLATFLLERRGHSVVSSADGPSGIEEAARLLDPYAEYDAGGWEAHHNRKADSPSGTAKAIVERVLSSMTRKTQAVYETLENRPPEPHELHYPSLRLGSVPGTHTVFFDSNADTIELTHTARSREGFATGAVVAAEWLMGKRGIFTMDDVLS